MAEPSELWRRIARAGAQIDPGLSDRDVERLVVGARRLARRRALRRGGAALVLAVVAAGAVGLVFSRRGREVAAAAPGGQSMAVAAAPVAIVTPSAVTPRAVAAPRVLRLSDGSLATALDDGTELAVREVSARRIAIELGRGRGRFEVTPRPERTFVVRAGEVGVTVLGTIFRVERVAARIGVEVERGRVLVEWGSGSRHLVAGQGGWFPPLQGQPRTDGARPMIRPTMATRVAPKDVGSSVPARRVPAAFTSAPAATTPAASPAVAPTPVTPPRRPSTTLPGPAPVAQASRPAVPRPAPPTPAALAPPPAVHEASVESLLAEADAARVDGRVADAVVLLRQAIDRHRSDRRAPLAAFTLGRVLLMELARPREAAAAFAQARALAPQGAFAEDALAREVEAWAKAGERVQARGRADEYRRLYPTGRRAATVSVFGGLE